jgi:hypothetical protein
MSLRIKDKPVSHQSFKGREMHEKMEHAVNRKVYLSVEAKPMETKSYSELGEKISVKALFPVLSLPLFLFALPSQSEQTKT